MAAEPHVATHGGDLASIARRYGVAPERLLDFSANVNPYGPPRALRRALERAVRDRRELARYPAPDVAGLVAAIARRLAIDPASVVVANGAAALLDAAVRVRALERCLVPQPAFSEDARALAAANVTLVAHPLARTAGFALDGAALDARLVAERCDALLVTNPNNPSGAVAERSTMLAIARRARANGVLTIVDEAFVDYVPHASVARDAACDPQTIVIRSLTKFYGVPSLRAGYAVCEPALAARLRATLAPWPVTTLVARAFVAALADRRYDRQTLARNARERARLCAGLRAAGFAVVEGGANFVLARLPALAPAAAVVTDRAIRIGRVVVRDCTSYDGLEDGRFVRVAVRTRRENGRLIAALRGAVREEIGTAAVQ